MAGLIAARIESDTDSEHRPDGVSERGAAELLQRGDLHTSAHRPADRSVS